MELQNSQDAHFFEIVHQLLQVPEKTQGDRRQCHRHRYSGDLLVAPYDGRTRPAIDSFRRTTCRDLSAEGFGFFSDERPTTERIVVILAGLPNVLFVVQIANTTEVLAGRESRYLVGCKIAGRLP